MALFKILKCEPEEMIFRLTTEPTPHEEALGIPDEKRLTGHWISANGIWHEATERDLKETIYKADRIEDISEETVLTGENLETAKQIIARHIPAEPVTEAVPEANPEP